uniref:Pyridoxamine 5'-phosphate oxidase family protein n=1 Tax=Desulfobacca acetoxidans TaxID=60893 RepID=A0A7V6A195_9BACT
MFDAAEMEKIVQELLHRQRLAVLATLMSDQLGRPYTNLIAFVATYDLKEIVFATNRATRKFKNLAADPRVSLLVDNRSNQETDFGEASAVTILGTAGEISGPEREARLQLFLSKHPYLEEFVTAPTCALVSVKVEKYILVTRFQEVREIYPAL